MICPRKDSPRSRNLEPVVSDASAVPRQVVERIQSVKVVDRDLRHHVGFGETQVYGDTAASGIVLPLRQPECHAATRWAEVKLDGLASYVSPSFAGDLDAFIEIVIGPKPSISPTDRAFESPTNRPAVAGTFDHFSRTLWILEGFGTANGAQVLSIDGPQCGRSACLKLSRSLVRSSRSSLPLICAAWSDASLKCASASLISSAMYAARARASCA